MVDDMLYYNNLEIFDTIQILHNDNTIYSVHSKLYPGICYSHTNDKLISLPTLTKIDS